MALPCNFSFTVFHPEGLPNDTKLPHLSDGPTLSGRGVVYVYYPNPWMVESNADLYDKPETFRLDIEGHSPLLRPKDIHDCGYYNMMEWTVDTRQYPNGPHKLTVASWLYFQTGEGSSKTVEVILHNPVNELGKPPPMSLNPNLPVPWPAEK